MPLSLFNPFYCKTSALKKREAVIPKLFKISSRHAAVIISIVRNRLFKRVEQVNIFFIIADNHGVVLPAAALTHKNNDRIPLRDPCFQLRQGGLIQRNLIMRAVKIIQDGLGQHVARRKLGVELVVDVLTRIVLPKVTHHKGRRKSAALIGSLLFKIVRRLN